MEELLKLIKANMKEGADIAAIETLVKGLNPLAGVKTVADVKEFIDNNDLFKSAKDSIISVAVESHDKKFTAEKLPGILKEKEDAIRKEINPKETDEQKAIRESKEEVAQLKADIAKSNLKTSLLTLKEELGYSGDVDLFLGLGDKAGDSLKAEAKRYKSAVDERVSKDIKDLYGDKTPRTSTVVVPEDIDAQIHKARESGNSGESLRLQQLKDRQEKKPA